MPKIEMLRGMTNLRGKHVLLRTSLNVPFADGDITDDFRIRRAFPTILYLQKAGAKTTILAHLGDPKESLKPIAKELQKHVPLIFVDDLAGSKARHAREALQEGETLLLQNVRSDTREKENDTPFAKELALGADLFVNDAFADSHRAHASIIGIPRHVRSAMGILFEEEVRNLDKALSPEHPSLFILGGAKFDTKEPLIKKFLELYDKVFVGGAVANDFFKAKGYEVGESLISPHWFHARALLNNPKLMIPSDVTVVGEKGVSVKKANDVDPKEKIYDVGPLSIFELSDAIANARFVLWNGPMGRYEEGFTEPTEEIAQLMSRCSAYSVVGGGDTVASIARLRLEKSFSFLSTGGGAMLEYLLNGTLPGIEALRTDL